MLNTVYVLGPLNDCALSGPGLRRPSFGGVTNNFQPLSETGGFDPVRPIGPVVPNDPSLGDPGLIGSILNSPPVTKIKSPIHPILHS